MRTPQTLVERLRKLLLDNPAGMTIKELSEADGSPQDVIIGALYRGYGFYIGGWQKLRGIQYAGVWRCVRVPEKAPKPRGNFEHVDAKEVTKAIKREEAAKRKTLEREQRRAANAKLKAQLVAERQRRRAEQAAIKEQAKAEKAARKAAKNVAPAHVPEKTFWQPVKPWPTQGARA